MPLAVLLPMLLPLLPQLIAAVPEAVSGVKSIFAALSKSPQTPADLKAILDQDDKDLAQIAAEAAVYKPLAP
jgi:hypothetical protein